MLVVEPVCSVKHALKTLKMIATSGFPTALECTKFVFGRSSAPDPAGGAHDAPPDPLVGWGGDACLLPSFRWYQIILLGDRGSRV